MQKDKDNPDRYNDMIHLPHHVSSTHPQMDISERAAQFSPFAALTGHGAAIQETARLTDEKVELDENSKEILDEKILRLAEKIKDHPEVIITYFIADIKKEGGSYTTTDGCVKKIDDYEGVLCLMDGAKIPIVDIVELEGEVFRSMEY